MNNPILQCINLAKGNTSISLKIVIYINYGLLLLGVYIHKLKLLQKKGLRYLTNRGYIAHTTLFIKHGLLNVRDMYKLKLLKFYCKLSYNLLPPYTLSLPTITLR